MLPEKVRIAWFITNVLFYDIGFNYLTFRRYHISVTVLIYILPLLVIGCAYTVVGITLWASEIPGDSSDRYHEQVTAKRKVVKMMIVVVCTFAVCWLPYHIFFMLQYIDEELFQMKAIQQIYLAIMWLAMSSTMYNPIIYCCLNERFRIGFKHVFRWCPFIRAGEYEGLEMRSTRFRIGFKHVFRWCPFIRAGEYEGLEMRSTRYLQTQCSMYKVSRVETTVSSVLTANDEDPDDSIKTKRLSLDLTSNGSSRSVSKTVSEASSFYSNTLS